MDRMRIAVTGGAGFIGANLCRELIRAEWVTDVVAVDNLSTGLASNLGSDQSLLTEGSILDRSVLDRAFDGADAVVHLAALPSVPRSIADPIASHEANATGTAEVLEAVRRHGIEHVIVASSSSVYGDVPTLPKHEDMAVVPLSPYAATKLATEVYALAWAHSFGIDVLALRFFNVFGPLQPAGHAYAAVIPAFVDAALDDRPLPVFGDGRQTRDFTFVGSVTTVLSDAIRRRVSSPQPVNLAFGTRTSLLELVALLESVLGRRLEREHHPPRPGDVRDSQADQTRLHSLFPDIEPISLEEGVRATVKWFEESRIG
jgi:UDP-glucose 4-epimerase